MYYGFFDKNLRKARIQGFFVKHQRYLHRQEEERKIADLNAAVKNWHYIQRVWAYLETLRALIIRKHGNIEPGSKANEYLRWAFDYADSLDPLVTR